MCTAITYKPLDFYFGRNLDLEYSYNEEIIITPRNFKTEYRNTKTCDNHFAIIGIGIIRDNFPLYYDAVNEHGLAIAGLRFAGNAVYYPVSDKKTNIASFELIPYILGKCKTTEEAKHLLNKINISKTNFSEDLPASPLHWIIADKNSSITLETLEDGMRIYDNPFGVLTNNPTFDIQMFNLNNYMALSPMPPVNKLSKFLSKYTSGMGAMGLPGDLSSMSRFVKANFTKINSVSKTTETEAVCQFFHILYSLDGCFSHLKIHTLIVYSLKIFPNFKYTIQQPASNPHPTFAPPSKIQ